MNYDKLHSFGGAPRSDAIGSFWLPLIRKNCGQIGFILPLTFGMNIPKIVQTTSVWMQMSHGCHIFFKRGFRRSSYYVTSEPSYSLLQNESSFISQHNISFVGMYLKEKKIALRGSYDEIKSSPKEVVELLFL